MGKFPVKRPQEGLFLRTDFLGDRKNPADKMPAGLGANLDKSLGFKNLSLDFLHSLVLDSF